MTETVQYIVRDPWNFQHTVEVNDNGVVWGAENIAHGLPPEERLAMIRKIAYALRHGTLLPEGYVRIAGSIK